MKKNLRAEMTWIDDGDNIEIYVNGWFLTAVYKDRISSEAMEAIKFNEQSKIGA